MLRTCFATIVATTVLSLGVSGSAHAGATTCGTVGSGPYCQYIGAVSTVYVNDANQILLYFDTPLDLSLPSGVGITGVTQNFAAAYLISDNTEFAKMLYATMLSAQSQNVTIGIQMRGSTGGYLKIDRVWINQP